MSLSYRKARTVGPAPGPDSRTAGPGRATAYRLVASGEAAPLGAAAASTAEPEPVFGTPDEAVHEPGDTVRSRWDNVVELFPGASVPAAKQGRRDWVSRFRYAEAGMATAEYAIATLAAVGFAGLLVVILRSDEVRGFLMTIIEQALTLG
ncbi:DUF4244 domain-containing protein [Arthrobacter castelli]|uniref:DUF4244 domain-containing protein n=1 Tax=Arthrobacter castelli TaxID=271431 RepID=UPI00041E7DBF|nr:DUF4244 domain-containing protein [Arthrobacter castelli]